MLKKDDDGNSGKKVRERKITATIEKKQANP